MKLYSILIFDNQKLKEIKYNLSEISYFYRLQAKNAMVQICGQMIEKMEKNTLYNITEERFQLELKIYGYSDLKTLFVVTDLEYPVYVAYELLYQLVNTNQMDTIWEKYQDPSKLDHLTKINEKLDQTKVILIETIDKLLERGDHLEDLLDQTEKLKFISGGFKKESAKLNKCCLLF
jgi:synaptobrevin family protein YKT6